jgi:hypothetical protein
MSKCGAMLFGLDRNLHAPVRVAPATGHHEGSGESAMQDERVTRAIEVFQDAWMLLSNLTYLRRSLPDPEMPESGKVPPDWDELRSYAVCIDTLRIDLRLSLQKVVTGLDARKELKIREALLPPSAKQFPNDPQSYLRWLDETMGGKGPEGSQ